LRAGLKAGCSPLRTVWQGQYEAAGEGEIAVAVADLVVLAFGNDDIVAGKEPDELTLSAGLLVEICVLLQQLHKSLGLGDVQALIVEYAKVANQAVVGHLVGPSEKVGRVGLGEQSLPDGALIGCGQMAEWTEQGIDECLVRAVCNPEGDGGARGQEDDSHSDRPTLSYQIGQRYGQIRHG
jgi:hypothetical protein